MGAYILVIDQGTTSSRAVIFDAAQNIVGMGRMDFTQHQPAPGWVEHVPEEIWATCLWACKTALRKAGITAADLAGISITNQRETTVVWDRKTGKAIHNAIVWRDIRAAETCQRLREKRPEADKLVRRRSGLMLAPYFSAPKVKWILDHVKGARQRARRGELAFGTVDSWLIWRLTGGRVHATDATNASRTLFYDLKSGDWHEDLIELFDVPASMLPRVLDSADDFGQTEPSVLGAAVPIHGVVGDQQAALIGQGCFAPGMAKSTYGTSCFALLNTGSICVKSRHRLLTTVAYRLGGKTTYALEGVIFTIGGALQWLRDDLEIIRDWPEADALAAVSDPDEDVYLVPAFSGLGAPWWDNEARGTLVGLTRNSRRAELVRAALEAVGYQSRDMFEAMRRDLKLEQAMVLRVDGGMVASDWTMQFLADILDLPVDCTRVPEVTALGAAWLTAWKTGLWPEADSFGARRDFHQEFLPRMAPALRKRKLRGWRGALDKALTGAVAFEKARRPFG
ncbi:glycerol kinase GlpK [Devosia sp. LjRoot3]|uniref:glycerol kinase GlpK n=1 Tax=Devosia sp. LjRoot3 TaxID=3342319 RepID=UPI003ECC8B9D